MNIDAKHPRGVYSSPNTGLTSNVLPEVKTAFPLKDSDTGVSTKNALSDSKKRQDNEVRYHWYALRTTYGRERKAYNYLVSKGVRAYLPTVAKTKVENGKRKTITVSRLPNIFFAYGTEDEIKTFVYDNVNLPFLRFYYQHIHEGRDLRRIPLIVPDYQIDSLKIICESEADDIIVSATEIDKFEEGQRVRVIAGAFEGVVGIVARYRGQQRVGVTIDGVMTLVTAYIPSAFIEKI